MRPRLIAAFAAVYLIWGSTYLAIRFAVETLPPMLMVGARFLIAGGLLLLWARFREGTVPSARDWRTSAVSGTLMLAGGNGAVVWAEQKLPSGIAALLVAVVPIWMVLLDWLRPGGRRPGAAVFAGLALGLAGLLLLVGPDALHGGGAVDLASAGVLLAGSLAWAVGSLYTQRAPRATSGSVGSATQMLVGGACSLFVALLLGEPARLDMGHASALSFAALGYLIVFGSLIAFTAYLYMLAHTTAAKAATYAYVNPIVAVLLGWAFASEPVSARTLLAAAVILAGVAIITLGRDAAPTPLPVLGVRQAGD
jgi:drug/metabolite transporter (DMT)-like permease